MFYGLTQAPIVIPERLYATPLSQFEPKNTSAPDVSTNKASEKEEAKPKSSAVNKKNRKKKGKKAADKDAGDQGDDLETNKKNDLSQGQATSAGSTEANMCPTWAKVNSSESDYSDTEGGQGSKLRSQCTKVRQCSLLCMLTVIRVS